MNTYIVFVTNAAQDVSGTEVAPTWAVITQARTEEDAVEKAATTGVLPASEKIHVCDLVDTQSFRVLTDVSVKVVPGITEYFKGEPPLAPEPPELPAPPVTNGSSMEVTDA